MPLQDKAGIFKELALYPLVLYWKHGGIGAHNLVRERRLFVN
jgi:hypothetical protein